MNEINEESYLNYTTIIKYAFSSDERGMGVCDIFSFNDLTLLFYSFLLDNFSFFISKRLYHTSFKLNNINFPGTLPPGFPINPRRGSQCPLDPPLVAFYFQIHAKRRIIYMLYIYRIVN